MELALSLGDASKAFSINLDKPSRIPNKDAAGFCIALGDGFSGKASEERRGNHFTEEGVDERRGSSDPPLQLHLLPFTPLPTPQYSCKYITPHSFLLLYPLSNLRHEVRKGVLFYLYMVIGMNEA